jgi:hypothetical protein
MVIVDTIFRTPAHRREAFSVELLATNHPTVQLDVNPPRVNQHRRMTQDPFLSTGPFAWAAVHVRIALLQVRLFLFLRLLLFFIVLLLLLLLVLLLHIVLLVLLLLLHIVLQLLLLLLLLVPHPATGDPQQRLGTHVRQLVQVFDVHVFGRRRVDGEQPGDGVGDADRLGPRLPQRLAVAGRHGEIALRQQQVQRQPSLAVPGPDGVRMFRQKVPDQGADHHPVVDAQHGAMQGEPAVYGRRPFEGFRPRFNKKQVVVHCHGRIDSSQG